MTSGEELDAGAAVLVVSEPSAGVAATACWPRRTDGGGDGGHGAARSACGVGRAVDDGAGNRPPWLLERASRGRLAYRVAAREGLLEWRGQGQVDIAARSWRA